MTCAGRSRSRSLARPVSARTCRTRSSGKVLAITPRLTWSLRRTPAGRPAGERAIAFGRPRESASMAQLCPYLNRIGPYLDQAKVRRAEQLDGKFVLTTNDDTLSVADVALGYKGMWIIESCFRRMKTTGLAVRPMFHWMPHRITAHVRLCVLALMIQ